MALTAGKIDEIVKEYLLFRGLISTSKQLETELKNEKEKKFRVDKLMETLHGHITSHDIAGLREYWHFLEQRLFSRLDQTYAPSIKKLETSLLKLYVVSASQANRPEKVTEFFEKMSGELQGQAEWREWFALPFTKNPDEMRAFAMYFTRQWQDTLFLTLHNFLSVIVRSMVVPSAFEYEEEARKIAKLQEENIKYKNMVSELQDGVSGTQCTAVATTPLGPPPGPNTFDLMDDFSVISQDGPSNQKAASTQPRTQQLRSFIKNISSSPIMGRKTVTTANKMSSNNTSQASTNQKVAATGGSKNNSGNGQKSAQQGVVPGVAGVRKEEGKVKPKVIDSQTRARTKAGFVVTPGGSIQRQEGGGVSGGVSGGADYIPPQESGEMRVEDTAIVDDESPYMLQNQDELSEHKACITHCRFNHTGSKIATADVDGLLKVWRTRPSPTIEATQPYKSAILSLDWTRSDKLLVGSKSGHVRVYDVKEKKTVKELTMDTAYPRVVSLACNPVGTSFVCSSVGRARSTGVPSGVESSNLRVGRLAIWDVKTMKVERGLPVAPNSLAVNWSSYNHNGQLVITGASDGHIRLYDTRKGECISSWTAHQGEVYSVLFSPDETSCYSMGGDSKFLQWSIHKTGQLVGSMDIHQGCAGPFVYTGHGGYHQVQTPKGKLFAFEPEGCHIVTCATNGAQMYKLPRESPPLRGLYLGGHRTPVVCVDWAPSGDVRLCAAGSMDGRVRLSGYS